MYYMHMEDEDRMEFVGVASNAVEHALRSPVQEHMLGKTLRLERDDPTDG
jgi:hypothetical protein